MADVEVQGRHSAYSTFWDELLGLIINISDETRSSPCSRTESLTPPVVNLLEMPKFYCVSCYSDCSPIDNEHQIIFVLNIELFALCQLR